MSQVQNRVFGLDLLRAFAILFVVMSHGASILTPYPHGYRVAYLVLDGVSLFFVLSGFLIGRILLKTIAKPKFGIAELSEFWIRRWMRTIPNYFFVLIFLVLAHHALSLPLPSSLFSYFTFSQNLVTPHPKFFGEAWSLAVEEWFYLTLPVPFLIAAKFPNIDRRKVVLATIVLVVLCVTGFRFYRAAHDVYLSVSEWDSALRKQVVTRLDSLMYGVAGAYASLYYKTAWSKHAKLLLIIGIAAILFGKLMSSNLFYLSYFDLTITPIATLSMLPFLSSWERKGDFLTSAVTFISVTSYAAYLLNLNVVSVVLGQLYHSSCPTCSTEPAFLYLMYWVVTYSLAYMLYRFYELPMTSLRDKWATKRFKTSPPPAIQSLLNR